MSDCRISNRYFWESIGIKEYAAIDMDGAHGAYQFDMNKPLEHYDFTRTFDIVTNFGTSEHVFNQANFFENVHNLAKESALMLHVVPILGNIGHSLYLYQVDFFDLLARENNYLVLGMWLVDKEVYYEYSDERLSELKAQNRDINLAVLLQKGADSKLNAPYQIGAYKSRFSFLQKERKKALAWEFFTQFLKKNGVSEKPKYRCAIFGAASAGEIALLFCKWQGIDVLYFIDDYVSGEKEGIKVISRANFMASECDFILKGCYQKGDIRAEIPVLELPIVVLEEAE